MENRDTTEPAAQGGAGGQSGAHEKDDETASTEKIHVAGSETASHAQVDLTAEQVRQGHTGDHVRYILAASIAGVIIVFTVAWLIFLR